MIEQRINELKAIIVSHDGRNAADARFARAVDDMLRAVYDDIGQISLASTRALFDLFVIKVLYVGRGSSDAAVLEYLAALLDEYLYARNAFPATADGRPRTLYFSDMLDAEKRAELFASPFEAYRAYGDNALFVSGVFPRSLVAKRPSGRTQARRRRAATIDAGYYVTTGKAMYRMASRHEAAEEHRQRETLFKLAEHFEIYMDALNELSERYITGFDLELIADKMLDNFNRYRESRDDTYLTNARRYAAVLQLTPERFPALFAEEADGT